MQFAYGTMGLSPEQLAGLTPFQFELKCKGYTERLVEVENNFRKLAFITLSPHLEKKSKADIDTIWPVKGSKKRIEKQELFSKKQVSGYLKKFQELKNKQNG